MNTITLSGVLQEDATIKTNDGGTMIASFNLRVFGGRKDKATDKWMSDFFRCKAFNKTAERLDPGKKGDYVTVRGRMQNNRYEKDGQKRDGWEVLVDEVEYPTQPRPTTDEDI